MSYTPDINEDNIMDFSYILILGVVLSVILFPYIYMIQKGNENEIKKKILDLENFKSDLIFVGATGVAIDKSKKKVAFVDYNHNLSVVDYKDILSVETCINGEAFHITDRGNQVTRGAIGGLLLGPAGLLIGALTSKKKQVEKIDKVSVKVRIKNLDYPTQEIIFLNTQVKKDSFVGNVFLEKADEWITRFNIIINDAKN